MLAGMYRLIPSIKHPREAVPEKLPACVQDASLSDPRLEKLKDRDGRFQFGTLGRGNHFVELQADEQDRLWLMVHSGSRGMGQAITAHHLKKAREAGQSDKLVRLRRRVVRLARRTSPTSPGRLATQSRIDWRSSPRSSGF